MKLNDDQHGSVPNSSAVIPPTTRNERVDKWIRFYRSKFHLFSIPLAVILSIVHLKFAVEYLGQCTIQPMINTYMIVHASVTIFISLVALLGVINARCIYPRAEATNGNMKFVRCLLLIILIVTLILFLFSLAWLVLGSVWVFGAKTNGVQGSDPNITTTYCQSELYRAAFVLIIINYVVHVIIIVVFIVKQTCRKKVPTIPPLVATTDKF